MAKFSKKRLDKYVQRNAYDITRGYISHGGRKDRRSEDLTVADAKRATKLFEKNVKEAMERNPGMTTIEAARKVQRSNQFNIKEDISKENMQITLRKFGINVQKRSLQWDESLDSYKIIGGRYTGRTVTIVHTPGSFPSYQIVLI